MPVVQGPDEARASRSGDIQMTRPAPRASRLRTGATGLRALATEIAVLAVMMAGTGGLPATVRAAVVSRHTEPASAVVVGPPAAARPIAPGFLGLSLELSSLPFATEPADGVLVQLIKNLTPGARPILRLGGQSTDWTWWPIPGLRRPRGVYFYLTKAWLQQTGALAQATDARLIVGINLFSGSPRVATVEAREIVDAVGRRGILALEPGNEPELYPGGPSPRATGTRLAEEQDARYRAFTHAFSSVVRALPPSALAGPSIGSSPWLSYVSRFVKQERRVRLITIHRYPLVHCRGGGRVSIGELLSPASSLGLAQSVEPYVRLAHAEGDRLRVDEMNSVSCGGQAGVSDTFASALWALNTLFEMARAGVDGVNVHSNPTSVSRLFTIVRSRPGWRAAVRPEYYGLLAFALAAPAGSRLLQVSQPPTPGLQVWATRTATGDQHVVLINDTSGGHTIEVRVPGGGRISRLVLRAPGLGATGDVTLGGQSFGSATTTGLLPGALRWARTTSSSRALRVEVPPASAVLLARGAGATAVGSGA
jgi:hypothetical protein